MQVTRHGERRHLYIYRNVGPRSAIHYVSNLKIHHWTGDGTGSLVVAEILEILMRRGRWLYFYDDGSTVPTGNDQFGNIECVQRWTGVAPQDLADPVFANFGVQHKSKINGDRHAIFGPFFDTINQRSTVGIRKPRAILDEFRAQSLGSTQRLTALEFQIQPL